MKQIIKEIGSNILFKSGLLNISSFSTRILAFHRVNPKYFEKQINYLRKKYNIIPLKKALSNSNNNVVLTFDDGYKNNFKYAYPVLKRFGIPATIFIIHNFIGNNTFAWWDKVEHHNLSIDVEELKALNPKEIEDKVDNLIKENDINPVKTPEEYSFMSWEEINKIKDVFEIGSHTVSHPILTNISLEDANKEIIMSKLLIEKKIGREIVSFAYPNGNWNHGIRNCVKDAGYEFAVTYTKGNNNAKTNPYLFCRRGINEKDSLEIFATKVAGVF